MAYSSFFDREMPPQCTPTSDFLVKVSIYFGSCVPTPLAFISSLLGTLSIVSWLFAQMPQIYKNYQIQSTAGLSILFLTEWLMGDLANLLGALFTHQATWQVIIACYYTFVDVCLVIQFFWYTHLKPRYIGTSLHSEADSDSSDAESDAINALSPINTEFPDPTTTEMLQQKKDSDKPKSTEARTAPIFSPVDYAATSRDGQEEEPPTGRSYFDWTAMASPRTVWAGVAASLASPARAAPILLSLAASQPRVHQASTMVEVAGTIISWCSTLLYLGSRIPQLYKNWSRQSTAGLSPLLFMAAFMGNFFYSASLLTNPNAWNSFDPYGGHGWADEQGSDQTEWVLRATPFFLGAAGVLFLDGMMGVQFLAYGEREEEMIRVRDGHGRRRWERVSGWMRGWIPRMSSKSKIVDLAESQRLLAESREIEQFERYGGVQSWH